MPIMITKHHIKGVCIAYLSGKVELFASSSDNSPLIYDFGYIHSLWRQLSQLVHFLQTIRLNAWTIITPTIKVFLKVHCEGMHAHVSVCCNMN